MDFIGHFTLVDNSLLSDIGAVAVQRLAHILFFEQRFQLLGIVVAGWSHHPVVDEFGAFIDLDMVFVAIETGVVFLQPPGVNVFLAKLVGLLFPGFRRLACLDLRVFLAVVALARHFDNGGIDQLSVFGKDAVLVKRLIEPEKQHLDKFFLNQRFPEFPDRFAVRNFVAGFQSQKALEAQPVGNLVLRLIVGKVVQALKNEKFEHHQPVEWRAAHVLAVGWLAESYFENGSKKLPVDMRFKFDERILEFGKPFEQKMLIKKAERVDVFHCSTVVLMGTAQIYEYCWTYISVKSRYFNILYLFRLFRDAHYNIKHNV